MNTKISTLLIAAVFLFLQIIPSYAAKPFFDFGLNFSHEDNIGRAEQNQDIHSDNILNLSAAASYMHQLGYNSGVLLKAGGQWSDYNKFTKLDNLMLDITATYKYKPNLHYTSPWFSLGIRLSESIYNKSDLRDNYAVHVDVMSGKRFTDRILLKTGLGYKHQNARTDQVGLLGGKLFDIEYHKAFIGADYFYKQSIFYTQYTYQNGDVVSSSSTPTRKIVIASDEVQWDDALTDDSLVNSSYGVYGYRLDATTHIVDFGINYALNRASALDLNIQYINVRGDGGNNYTNYVANIGLLYRFK